MNPLLILKNLYRQYSNLDNSVDYSAVILSTYVNNIPSSRVVLIKDFSEQFLTFATNLNSRKAGELIENPICSLCFHWPKFKKQVRIIAKSEIISEQEADIIFENRPYGHKIQALVSKQSEILENFDDLKNDFAQKHQQLKDTIIERPKYWSGFKLYPTEIEFWEDGENRLHKREFYYLKNKIWHKHFLYP